MKRYLCYAFLCIAFFACKPDISVNQDFDIPSVKALRTSSDLENTLQSAFALLRSEDCYGAAWMLWPEIMTDNFQLNPNFSGQLPERNIFNRVLLPNDTLIANSWRSAFRVIALANTVIDAIENGKIEDGDFALNKNRFLGEAYFLRGITYFELVRFFAPQFSEETRALSAIPIFKSISTSVELKEPSSVEVVYEQILSDLNLSILNLGVSGRITNINDKANKNSFFPLGAGFEIFNRPTVHIARSIKARVLVQTGLVSNMALALAEINNVIEDRSDERFSSLYFEKLGQNEPQKYFPMSYPLFGSFSSDLNGMFTGNEGKFAQSTVGNNYEFIFSLMNFQNDKPLTDRSYYLGSKFSLRANQNYYNTQPPFAIEKFPISSQGKLFRRGTDKRYRAFFPSARRITTISLGGRDTVPAFNKFNGLIFNIPVVRSADLILLRAEINIKLGFPRKALYDLLHVKYRANMAPEDTVDIARDSVGKYYRQLDTNPNFSEFLFREIIRERKREFFGEGDRLHTLRRNKLDIPGSDRGAGLPWNSPSLVFPIPAIETSLNSKIK